MFIVVHVVCGISRSRYKFDDGARSVELLGVFDIDAKFFLDARKELIERPAHEHHSSGSAPPRATIRGITDGLEYNLGRAYIGLTARARPAAAWCTRRATPPSDIARTHVSKRATSRFTRTTAPPWRLGVTTGNMRNVSAVSIGAMVTSRRGNALRAREIHLDNVWPADDRAHAYHNVARSARIRIGLSAHRQFITVLEQVAVPAPGTIPAGSAGSEHALERRCDNDRPRRILHAR